MKKAQASMYADKLNNMETAYEAVIDKIGDKYIRGYPYGIIVKHRESGNESGYAREVSEIKYIIAQIDRRRRK